MTADTLPDAGRPPDPHIVRVLAPDARRLSPFDVRRMLGGLRPHHARGGGLDRGRQMVAIRGDEPVGVAAFEMDDESLFVHVLAVSAPYRNDAVPALLGALELACLAAGGRRLAVTVHADIDVVLLGVLGYEADPSRVGWFFRHLA